MSKFDTTDHYFSGQGVVMVGKRTAGGKPAGLFPIGNVPALKIAMAITSLEHKESHTGQRGTDKRLTTETKCNLSLVLEKFDKANLAMAMRASVTDVASGSVTDVAYDGYPGAITPLAHIKISAVTVESGLDTLVAYPGAADGKWDYKVNEDAGSLMINPVAADRATVLTVTDGVVSLLVSYTYAAQERIDALTEGAEDYYLRFEGLNTAEGNEPVVVEVFKFSSDPLKELSLIADGIQQFNLDGSVLADPLQPTGSQFFKVLKLKSA